LTPFDRAPEPLVEPELEPCQIGPMPARLVGRGRTSLR
jgi:hypothetical protein